MTRLAIDRIFAQHCPGGSGMDFPAFCTFCAAWEARHHPAAVRYFFAVLDLQGRGYLAPVRKTVLVASVDVGAFV